MKPFVAMNEDNNPKSKAEVSRFIQPKKVPCFAPRHEGSWLW